MGPDLRKRSSRRLAAVVLALLALTACGGEDDVGDSTHATANPSEGKSETILIKTQVELAVEDPRYNSEEGIPQGDLLGDSTLGDSAFCPGGTFRDRHGGTEIGGLVDRTFECPDGTLRIAFTPGPPQGRTQRGTWRVVEGTGAYEGSTGGGGMQIVYERGSDTKGRETFDGTIVR